jgi:hypothetical protein
MTAINYKEFAMTVVRVALDQWRVDIRRLDGRKVKTYSGEFDVIPGKVGFSEDAVVQEAKRLIDAGGMSVK